MRSVIGKRRKILDRSIFLAAFSCTLICGAIFVAIFAAIFLRGAPAVSLGFLGRGLQEAGASGGVLYNTIGTLILAAGALAVSAPLALGLSLLYSAYLKESKRLRRTLFLFLTVLNSVPSILLGLFGMMVFVEFFDWGKSWLSGAVVLGILIVPTVTVSVIERMEAIPAAYIESGAALGLPFWRIITSILIPLSSRGLLTGLLLGLARAAGETAPIMFTATVFSGATIPTGIRDNPVLSLPYHIFVLAQESFDPRAGTNLWGAALVLIALVSGASLIALVLRSFRHGH